MPVDSEHAGVRLAIPLIAVVAFVAGYVILSTVANASGLQENAGCIAFAGAITAAAVLSAGMDGVLKRYWSSGRRLIVEGETVRLVDQRRGSNAEIVIQSSQRLNAQAWRFRVTRSSARVPKGWFMLGLRLMQDETSLIVYTFMGEKEAETLTNYAHFKLLLPRKDIEAESVPLREKGEQRRLYAIEQERWEDGAELQRGDFMRLLEKIQSPTLEWQS